MSVLKRLERRQVRSCLRRPDADAETEATVRAILDDVERDGDASVRKYSECFGELRDSSEILLGRAALLEAASSLDRKTRDLLERSVARVRAFADAQRASVAPFALDVPGGKAYQEISPVEKAGCYAPGGRYPLPSSAIMTVATARAAGVRDVYAASPNPTLVTLAAAGLAGADGFLRSGGAQGIAAFAFGYGSMAPRDVIVGPGNRYVTAAKRLLSGRVGIDMLAGPSELVVVADATACAATVAIDLLAQAEHDPDSAPYLVALSASVADAVDSAIAELLVTLPTADIARKALLNGACFVVSSAAEAAAIVDVIAPEHLELCFAGARGAIGLFTNFGALFVGEGSAEVFGDYCAGPNHVLPTGGSSRFSGGLSVFTFLRIRTGLDLDDPGVLAADAAAFARLEGLEAHARAAEARLSRQ